MGYAVRVVADSITPNGHRITTIEATYPRFIHSEMLTHRVFCLAGDMELEFDLPQGRRGYRRVYTMKISDFVDKWINGARRFSKPPRIVQHDLSWISKDKMYSSNEIVLNLGMSSASNINAMCRDGKIASAIKIGGSWHMLGADILKWRAFDNVNNRYSMQPRLASMQIRQLNEATGNIQLSNVTDAVYSGEKDVFEVRAGKFLVAGSLDHRVLTDSGWKAISQIVPGKDYITTRKMGKRDEDLSDPQRLRKIDGRWRVVWQRNQRDKLSKIDPLCRSCKVFAAVDVHHIISVYERPDLAFEEDNITVLCKHCHKHAHTIQGWQGGTYRYGKYERVDSVVYRGNESTYDLSIAGDFDNYVANGVIVHNSRNSSSSRAIPIEKMIEQVMNDPVVPVAWGKNQRGMQAHTLLSGEEQIEARIRWDIARRDAIYHARILAKIGAHKQIVNRILEPWMWITVLITSTEWYNFLGLRQDWDSDKRYKLSFPAQPEMQVVAHMIRDAIVESVPETVEPGSWHVPFGDDVLDHEKQLEIAVGRCARVSYLTHNGVRDFDEDIRLFNDLMRDHHWSPFEHVAKAMGDSKKYGNFISWVPLRSFLDLEPYTTNGWRYDSRDMYSGR